MTSNELKSCPLCRRHIGTTCKIGDHVYCENSGCALHLWALPFDVWQALSRATSPEGVLPALFVHRALALVERSLDSEKGMRAVMKQTGGNAPELVQGILDKIVELRDVASSKISDGERETLKDPGIYWKDQYDRTAEVCRDHRKRVKELEAEVEREREKLAEGQRGMEAIYDVLPEGLDGDEAETSIIAGYIEGLQAEVARLTDQATEDQGALAELNVELDGSCDVEGLRAQVERLKAEVTKLESWCEQRAELIADLQAELTKLRAEKPDTPRDLEELARYLQAQVRLAKNEERFEDANKFEGFFSKVRAHRCAPPVQGDLEICVLQTAINERNVSEQRHDKAQDVARDALIALGERGGPCPDGHSNVERLARIAHRCSSGVTKKDASNALSILDEIRNLCGVSPADARAYLMSDKHIWTERNAAWRDRLLLAKKFLRAIVIQVERSSKEEKHG